MPVLQIMSWAKQTPWPLRQRISLRASLSPIAWWWSGIQRKSAGTFRHIGATPRPFWLDLFYSNMFLFLWETHVNLENPQNYEILGCTIHFYPSLVRLAMDCWVYMAMGLHCRILYKTDQSVALIDMCQLGAVVPLLSSKPLNLIAFVRKNIFSAFSRSSKIYLEKVWKKAMAWTLDPTVGTDSLQ